MSLITSEVYRCLEKKTLILGFEIFDLFVVFSVLAILNLLFGGMPYKFIWTWTPAIALAIGLKLGKVGKAEHYLSHLVKFHISPGLLSAFSLASRRQLFLTKKRRV